METMTVVTDGRGRMTLGGKDATYRVIQFDDGAMLLEPARVVTEAEWAVVSTPGMVDRINAAMADAASARVVKRRSARG